MKGEAKVMVINIVHKGYGEYLESEGKKRIER